MSTATATATVTTVKTAKTKSGLVIFVLTKTELIRLMGVSLSSFNSYLQLVNQLEDYKAHKNITVFDEDSFCIYTGYTEYQLWVLRCIDMLSKNKTLYLHYRREGEATLARHRTKRLTDNSLNIFSFQSYINMKNDSDNKESLILSLTEFK